MPERNLHMSIDSCLDNSVLVGLAIHRICQHFGQLDDVDAYRVELSVVEAVNNCIRHAYVDTDGEGKVDIDISVQDDRVGIRITDFGPGIPKERVTGTPTLDFDEDDYSTLPEGGMGLFIIHQVMDEVDYASVDGANTLSMTKVFEKNAEQEQC